MTTPQASAAGTWRLGDLTVNRLGLGAMRLTGTAAFGAGRSRDREASVAVVRRAVELGVDHLDTAAFYFAPTVSANEVLATALRPYADGLVVATKVGPARDASGAWLPFARPDQLRGQVEENLRQLGRDHLDLVTLRLLGRGPLADHLGALADLQRAGMIRQLGLSNVGPAQLLEAQAVAPVVAVQNRFGLGSRRPDADEVLRLCGELGIAFTPYFAIAGEGREAGVGEEAGEPEQVRTVASRLGVSTAQVRIAWTLAQAPYVLAIPGTGRLDHLEDNVAAAALRLTEEDLALLATV